MTPPVIHSCLQVRGARRGAELGMTIVETLVTQSLRGTVRFADEGGTLATVRFPQVKDIPKGDFT